MRYTVLIQRQSFYHCNRREHINGPESFAESLCPLRPVFASSWNVVSCPSRLTSVVYQVTMNKRPISLSTLQVAVGLQQQLFFPKVELGGDVPQVDVEDLFDTKVRHWNVVAMVPRIEHVRVKCMRRSRRLFLRTCWYYYHLNCWVRCGTITSKVNMKSSARADPTVIAVMCISE
jgi:hypothetical protein